MSRSAPSVLRIAADFTLPLEAVTETIAILAKRGAGKSYCASVLVEEFIKAGLPVCVIDPVGAWFGLRSSADGTRPGLPVVIFGGEHADVPLDETAGARVAKILVEQRFPAILDLSLLSKNAGRRFVADFLEYVYHHNREPLHLVIDEADLFAPQRSFTAGAGDEARRAARLLGAYEDVVRRGRRRGLGCTSITQRPAVLHKDILSQSEVLIALRMTGTRDVAAINEWVQLHDADDQASQVKGSLAALPVGTAWIWSPGWLGTLTKVTIRRRETFDSGATPKPGATRVVPTRWARVDVAALTKLLEVPNAESSGRVGTGKEVAAWQAEVGRLRAELTEARQAQRVEVPVFDTATTDLMRSVANVCRDLAGALQAVLAKVDATPQAMSPRGRPTSPAPKTPAPVAETAAVGQVKLGRAERAILTVLAQHGPLSIVQIAMLTGYASNGGGFRNALGALRTANCIEGGRGQEVTATLAGVDALGEFEELPTGRALVEWWLSKLGKAERTALQVVVEAWPAEVPVDVIANRAGYAVNGGGFRNALGRLRTLELASGYRGAMKANDTLGQAWNGR